MIDCLIDAPLGSKVDIGACPDEQLCVQATPVYRTNDPFTFKINDFKLPSDLVDDIVNKRYPACLAVLITESLELEGLWVPSASPNIKDKVCLSSLECTSGVGLGEYCIRCNKTWEDGCKNLDLKAVYNSAFPSQHLTLCSSECRTPDINRSRCIESLYQCSERMRQ